VRNSGDNPICRLFGCTRPIVLAGMGGVARSELVAAVTRAGGFGFLGMVREPPALIVEEVGRLRAGGVERFGVNIIPAATGSALLAQQVETILQLRVPAVTLFWDINAALVRRLRDAGIVVAYQVGSTVEAIEAERAGAHVIIAQGREAGGHVRGDTPLQALLPQVSAAVKVPVLAAGGLSSGADLVAALALGASGIVLGTALLGATESFAHDYHKLRLIAAEASDTLLTDIFHINWPRNARVRVLSSAVTAGGRGTEVEGARVAIGSEDGRSIYLFSTDSPLRTTSGDLESMALYAGTGVGRIGTIRGAGAILDEIAAEAERLLATTRSAGRTAEPSSAVCYAGEMGGEYMGLLDEEAAAEEAAKLANEAVALLAATGSRNDNAPPFSAELLSLSPWLLPLLRPGAAGRSAPSGGLAGRIGLLAARVPEGMLRQRLVALRVAMDRIASLEAERA
jgi:nitronate monooxygenase